MDYEEQLRLYESKNRELEHQISELTHQVRELEIDKIILSNGCAVFRHTIFIVGWLCLNLWLSPLLSKSELNFFIEYLIILSISAVASCVLFFVGYCLSRLLSTGMEDLRGTKIRLYIAIPLFLLTPLLIHYLPWFLYNS